MSPTVIPTTRFRFLEFMPAGARICVQSVFNRWLHFVFLSVAVGGRHAVGHTSGVVC
jgi:hypothetical protein